MCPLERLIDDGVIDASRGRLKSGKEADVYLVDRRDQILVAKIYKDRAQRSFKNNAVYKEGRKTRNSRTKRAIESGSKYGREAEEEAWKGAEADALFQLHDAGVRVPEPVMFYGGVLLMELVKDAAGNPAPRLIDVAFDAPSARANYFDLRGQMVRMLCCHTIHGDLSPYNILAGEAGPTIIDFPQIISAAHSTRASFFFLRDFENVLRFLARTDASLSAHMSDGRQIWRAYERGHLTPEFVPSRARPERSRSGPKKGGRRDARGRQGTRSRGRAASRDSKPKRASTQAKPEPGRGKQSPASAKSSSGSAAQASAPTKQSTRPAKPSAKKPVTVTDSGTATAPARRRRRRRRRRRGPE